MVLPSTGPLSLYDISQEFGGATPHSLSEYYGSGGAPGSGTISIGDFYGRRMPPKYLDCRQNNQNTTGGVFSSVSVTGSNIHYQSIFNNGTAGVGHAPTQSYLDFTAGSSSYAIATQSSMTISNLSFTMEVWIRPDNFSSGNFNTQAVMYRGGTGLRGDIATINTGKVRFRWSGADSGLQSSTSLSTGTWYHIVGIFHAYNYVGNNNAANSGMAAIFINGSNDSSVSLSGSRVKDSSSTTNLMSFGFYNSQNGTSISNMAQPTYGFYYDGKIGHVRFYDGPLSSAQILQNYNASKGDYGYGSNSGSIV